MALAALKGLTFTEPVVDTSPSHGSLLLDATGKKAGIACFKIPKTGSITKVHFRTGVVTTSDSLDLGLYTMDLSAGNGHPTTTAYGGMAAGAQASVASNSWYSVTLATAATATRGDACGLVASFTSYVAGNLNISYGEAQLGVPDFPYADLYAAAWTKQAVFPTFALEYSDGTIDYVGGTAPTLTYTTVVFSSASIPDERALRVIVPGPMTLDGFRLLADFDGDAAIKLYEGTTERATSSIDADFRSGTAGRWHTGIFNAPYNLAAGVTYYLSVLPGAANIGIQEFTVNAAAIMDAFPGGQSFCLATRTDAGAWSITTAARPLIQPIFSAIDNGAGGGGGMLVHPGMTGGARG